jgi:RNA polymerase sigma-70 factor (ECF subfamily)
MEVHLEQSPPELSDQHLTYQAQQGDRGAFSELVRRHYAAIYRVCFRILFDKDDAADATQEVFLRAFKNLGSFRGGSTFKTWLVRIAVNTSLTARGQQTSDASFDELAVQPSLSAEADVMRIEALVQLHTALHQLPLNHRIAVILRDLEGYSYADIATAMDVPEGTAKGWVFRGRVQLKDVLT